MMNDYWGRGSYGNNGWDMLFMMLFMVLVILGIVLIVRYLNQNNNVKSNDQSLDILKSRYAKGEIDKKEFEQKRKDLS